MTDGVIHSPDSLQNQTIHVAPNDQILDVVKPKRGRTKLRYICDICNREFTKKCGLANHLLIHAGVKPFTCEICKKSFTKKCTLTVHLLTHSSERPHVCDVCTKSFARKTDLHKHKFIHTGVKPHICDICSKRFAHQNNLRRHKVKHLPKINKNANEKVTQVNENLLKVWKETSKVKNFPEALKQCIIKKLHSSTAQTLQDNMSDSSATISVSGSPASNYNGGNSSAANLIYRQPPSNYDGSNSCAAIALNKLPSSIYVNVGTINEEQCNNAKSKMNSNSKLNLNSIAENGSVNSLFVSSLSKENSQTPISDSINAENVAENHFMDLEESNDTKNAREIKDICKSLSITIDNDSKIEKTTKSLLNAFSSSKTKSKETQIFLKLENLQKNKESSKFFCKNQTSISSESNKLLEKSIAQKYFCRSSADNDLEQDLTVASDVLKNINNNRLLLQKDPNVGPSTLKTCEGDTQCSNTSINILNKVEFMPSFKKDFQSNAACETENNLLEDAHMLNISSHVSRISIPFNYLLMPKIENTQHISHELKFVDDIVKEYKTSQISLPSKDVDIQILSTFHDNVQPIPNESYNDNVRTVQTPSTTVAESVMDALRNKTDSGIEMNAPGNVKIPLSTFNDTEEVVLDYPKPFVCDLCKASFTAQKEYLMHVVVHLTESQTTCYLCAKKFQDHVQLREHILRHNKGEDEELLHDKGNNDELLHDKGNNDEMLHDKGNNDEMLHNDELLHDKEVIDKLLYDKEEDKEMMHHKEGNDNSFDDDLCSLGTISPCDISLEDIESMNFDENFDEKITKMFALTCIEKLNGNASDSEDLPYDDEATILYSCEGCQPPKAHYMLTENQKSKISTTTFASSSDTELRGDQRALQSNTCLDFSNVRFISQTPAKTASNLDSQKPEVSVNNPQLSLKKYTECSFEPTSHSNCAEVNDLKLSSFIDIKTKKFNNSINHGLEIIKKVYDNFGEVVVNSVSVNEADNFSQNSFSENRSQFENAVTESLLLIDSKSNSDISIEINNNRINTADISSKLNKNLISTNQIENTLDNKLLIDETDAFSKLNSFTNVKQMFNTINEDLMIPKNQDEGIHKIATNKSIDNVGLELNLTSDVKQFINSTNEDLLMKQNQDKSIHTTEIYDNCIKETNDFLDGATNVDKNQTDSSVNYNLLMNGNQDNISKVKICGDVLSKLSMTNNTTQISTSTKDKLLMTYDKNKVKNKICYICNSGFSDRRGLLSHVKIHIKQAELKSVKEKLSENIRNCIMAMKEKFYECDVCKMLFARRDRLLKHRLTHTARDQHLCEYCGCTFKRKDQLKTHLASHRGNDFEDIDLNFGLNLGDADLVSLEPTLHTTKKTHTCSQCLKVYAKKSALQCHFLTHTGQRPHQCPLCDMAFAQRTNLKRHILSHSGIKPFMCNICRKHFARKRDLRKHYLSHSSEELFTLIGKLPDA